MSSARSARDGRCIDLDNHSRNDVRRERLSTENAEITLEHGPDGTVARINHDRRGVERTKPLDDETVGALREVAR